MRPQRKVGKGKPITVLPRARRKHDGPKKWSRVHGSVYAIRTRDAKSRRTLILRRPKMDIGYVGMYSGDWKERIRQHLYGGGRYQCRPKPWTDLVLTTGQRNAKTLAQQRRAVEEVIAAGLAYRVWHKNCFYWYVKLRESWYIKAMRPRYNILENTGNSRHVRKWDQEAQRLRRDQHATAHLRDACAGWRREREGQMVQWYGREAERYRNSFGLVMAITDERVS